MKNYTFLLVVALLLYSCNMMKRTQDSISIEQHTSLNRNYPRIDSLLIVANGNSATQRIMDDVIPIFIDNLKKRGIKSVSVFVSYIDKKIDEAEFNNRGYTYTLWIYEQDRSLQKLDSHDYFVQLAMKLTDNRTLDNVWVATSVFNSIVRKKLYNERYANTLILLFRANGIISN